MATKRKSVDDLLKEYDDPNYWDEQEDGDRREFLGVILSYADVKRLDRIIPRLMRKSVIQPLMENMERWTYPVTNRIK